MPINLEKKSEQGSFYDAYLIADDYMRSYHKEVKTGKVMSAFQKSQPNSIYSIIVEYESAPDASVPGLKYYRTTMQIDLTKYDFK